MKSVCADKMKMKQQTVNAGDDEMTLFQRLILRGLND